MTDEHQAHPEPIRLADLSPEEVARRLKCSIDRAHELIEIERDEWCGDLWTGYPDGTEGPMHHGKNWNPGPGERRAFPWPDGTYGPKPPR